MRHGTILPILAAALSVSAASVSSRGQHQRDDVSVSLSASSNHCSEPEVRPEWQNMSHEDQVSFTKSIACLMELPPKGPWNVTSRYDELVRIHLDHTDLIHNYGFFLAWHRYFVHGFHGMLKAECSYDGPFPWWNEIRDAGNFAGSGIFEPDLFGTLPEGSSPDNQKFCVEDGVFINRTVTAGYDKPRCLSRGEDKEASAMATKEWLAACHNNITTFEDHELCVQSNIHVSTHLAIGTMLGFVAGSVNDPVFFLHHSFIDWQWKRWQVVDEKRNRDVSGCAEFEDRPCMPVTLDTELTSWGIFPNMTVRDVADTEKGPLCYKYDSYNP